MTGKMVQITVEILDILATATKEIKRSAASESDLSLRFPEVDIFSEKFLKRVIGRTDLEDGVKKLERLIDEEISMAVVQVLKVSNNIDNNVTEVNENVLVVKSEVEVVNDNVKAVDDRLQGIADGRKRLFSKSPASSLILISRLRDHRQGSEGNPSTNGKRNRRREAFVVNSSSFIIQFLTSPQGINYEKALGNGNLHQIHPQITISRVIVNTRELRSGLSKATSAIQWKTAGSLLWIHGKGSLFICSCAW
jgi:hypothetical protein